MALLSVTDLEVRYGMILALRGISFKVENGQVVCLIGANGAGKSTTLNTISGLLKPYAGKIEFDGRDITKWRPDRICKAGLVQVPEGRQVIATMSVQENLEMGAYARSGGWLGPYLHPQKARKLSEEQRYDIEMVFKRFPRLQERRYQKAGSLSGGEQQMLAVGRALLARPKLMMLDEPSMGLAPVLVNEVFSIIKDLKAEGKTILLVEQNARKALEVADYAYVLERGQIIKSGPAETLRNDEQVIAAYLG
ncbi:MAG: ABC transporter ATP-binding protein [Phototrophicales bacterium]|nr:MAG: ABC transporter ATP-binding protein [Phototrophicales bacterium]